MSAPYVDPLPEGWDMCLDDATKTYYFIDHRNKSTQWQHPVNKLVYRPTQAQTRAVPNGYTSTQIPVKRHQEPSFQPRTQHDYMPAMTQPQFTQGPVPNFNQGSMPNSTYGAMPNSTNGARETDVIEQVYRKYIQLICSSRTRDPYRMPNRGPRNLLSSIK